MPRTVERKLSDRHIYYETGYKNKLTRDLVYMLPDGVVVTNLVALPHCIQIVGRVLTLKEGYAWDGSSGPTWDTDACKRASAIHDAWYQLMRLGVIALWRRLTADNEYYRLCVEDGKPKWWAKVRWRFLRWRGAKYAKPGTDRRGEKVAP